MAFAQKQALRLFCLAATLAVAGCQSPHRVADPLLAADLGLEITRIAVWRSWLKDEAGSGIRVEVWARADIAGYTSDLQPELDAAARICQALGGIEDAWRWDYIELEFHQEYLPGGGAKGILAGACRLTIRGKVLHDLHAGNAPPAEYAGQWRFLSGAKDELDGGSVRSW